MACDSFLSSDKQIHFVSGEKREGSEAKHDKKVEWGSLSQEGNDQHMRLHPVSTSAMACMYQNTHTCTSLSYRRAHRLETSLCMSMFTCSAHHTDK